MPRTAVSPHTIGAISELHQEFMIYGTSLLTKKGSLIGGVILEGKDADGLNEEDFRALALLARAVSQDLPVHTITTQYYAHFEGIEFTLRPRDHFMAQKLSQSRAVFLNRKRLSSSVLFHLFEVLPDERLSALRPWDVFAHCAKALFRSSSRDALRRHLSSAKGLVCFKQALDTQYDELQDIIKTACAKWDALLAPRPMTLQDLWAHGKFLANFDPYYLTESFHGTMPSTNWDVALPDGDRELVHVRNMDVMKCSGAVPHYVRIGAVNQFGGDRPSWGCWADGPKAPARLSGNYLLMMRFHPLSPFQRALLFRNTKRDLNRQNIDWVEAIRGRSYTATEVERRATMKPAIREALQEIEEVEMVPDHWGRAHAFFAVWDTDPEKVSSQSLVLRRAMDQAGLQTCWEGVGLAKAFRALMPGGRDASVRDVPMTTTQLGAATLCYRARAGQPVVEDLQGEECQYVFESQDGSPFYYSPFVEGSGLVVGVGPIRSGKSFTKTTLACHFLKYGGFLQGIDVDRGMEPIAQLFGADGAIFSMDDGGGVGFNPFVVCEGPEDLAFRHHLKQLIVLMLRTNDTPEMQTLTLEEQKQLDEAILATVNLDNHQLHRLRTVILHCPDSLQVKMHRWIHADGRVGMYARFFDSEEDAIGRIDRPMTAFNLRAIKENTTVMPLVMAEIFFRVTRLYEDPRHLQVPKYLDIDEAHALLSLDYVSQKIVTSIRTWGKYFAGMGLWSQSPQEFVDLAHWPALRSAASTFFFMADPAMETALYKKTFQLTDGECEAIRGLVPKKQAFIIQRKLGVAKVVTLEVEPQQYVVSTSKPAERSLRDQNIQTFGFEAGVDKTVEMLNLSPSGDSAQLMNH